VIACMLVVAFLVDLIPLWVFAGLIRDWARYEGVCPLWYRWIAVVGWLFGLVSAHTAAVILTARLLPPAREWAVWVGFATFLLAGLIGATIAPALAYLSLRLRTGHHPDYEPVGAVDDD
jgi:hypothetical protein